MMRNTYLAIMQSIYESIEGRQFKIDKGMRDNKPSVFFGRQALAQYSSCDGEGYFVKSAKYFLGPSGIGDVFIYFFEDALTLMMQHIKQCVEQHCQTALADTVIAGLVNFQGLRSE